MCERIPLIFDQAQFSTANHHKNCVALHKIQKSLSCFTQGARDGKLQHLGERLFVTAFLNMINRFLVIKKGSAPADRVVKFVGLYVRVSIDKCKWEMNSTLA